MSDSETGLQTAIVRVMTRIVFPLGTAGWALVELWNGATLAAEFALLVAAVAGVFLAFNTGVKMLDDRLNGEVV